MKITLKTEIQNKRLTRLIRRPTSSGDQQVDLSTLKSTVLAKMKKEGLITKNPITGDYSHVDGAKSNKSMRDVMCIADIYSINGNYFFDNVKEPEMNVSGRVNTKKEKLGAETICTMIKGKNIFVKISDIEFVNDKSKTENITITLGENIRIGQTEYNQSTSLSNYIEKMTSAMGLDVDSQTNDISISDSTVQLVNESNYIELLEGRVIIKKEEVSFDSDDAHVSLSKLTDNVLSKIINKAMETKFYSYDEITKLVPDFESRSLKINKWEAIEFTKKYMSQTGGSIRYVIENISPAKLDKELNEISKLLVECGNKLQINTAYINYKETPVLLYFMNKFKENDYELVLKSNKSSINKEFIKSKLFKSMENLTISDKISNTHDRYITGNGEVEVISTNQFIPFKIDVEDAKPLFNLDINELSNKIKSKEFNFEVKDSVLTVVPKGTYKIAGGK